MKSILFWLGLLVAILTGSIQIQQTSSIDSTNPNPQTHTIIMWPCLPYDGELCWWDIEKGNFGP